MGRKLGEDDVIRVMCQRIVGVSEERARIIASHIPTAEPSASDCWSNDNKTTNDSIVTKSSRYSTDRTTDDTISRQAAITIPILPVEHRKYQTMNLDDAYELGWFDCQKCIEELPSAQPEKRTDKRTETHACDLIDRQAAIDALFGLYEYQRDIDPTEAADLVRQGIYLAEKKIDQLPSAQPDLDEWCNTCREYDSEKHCCPRFNRVIRGAVEEVKAQPEQRWIPVTERLPENNRQVLVYAMSVHFALAKYDEMRQADGSYKMEWVTFDAWKPFYTIKNVIAWMPLPEPWEGENNGI